MIPLKFWSAVIVMVLAAVLAASAQIFFKGSLGMPEKLYLNPWMYAGLGCYAIGFLLMLWAYKFGEVSVLSPIMALSNFLVILFAALFLNEAWSLQKAAGGVVIILGIILVNV